MTTVLLIAVDPEACTGCRSCEVACSLFHSGECRPARSLVRVVSQGAPGRQAPVLCLHCADAPCLDACPEQALYRDGASGWILLAAERCGGCRRCAKACPLGAIQFPRHTKRAAKCDMCGGNPQCVEFCATQALRFSPVEDSRRPDSREALEAYRGAKRRYAAPALNPADVRI